MATGDSRRATGRAVGGLAVAAGVVMVVWAPIAAAVVPAPAPGVLAVVAGTGSQGAPTPGPATSSDLDYPYGVAADAAGNVYIAETSDNLIEKVTPTGTLSVIAGTTVAAAPTPGPATSSALDGPFGVGVDGAGDVFIADSGNNRVEEVTPAGTLSIIAGTGNAGAPTPGPATSSDLNYPTGVAVDAAGDVFIADSGNEQVEEVTPTGTLSVIAGTGNSGAPTPGPATSSDLSGPYGVAVDAAGDVYIADAFNQRVEEVTPTGTLSIIAGTGNSGAPTPGPATRSDLSFPSGVAVDTAGDVYISDVSNERIEEVTPAGTLSTIAGTGSQGAPTPGPATSSDLASPYGVAVDTAGDVYIADTANQLVEEVGSTLPPPPASVPEVGLPVLLAVPLAVAGSLGYVLRRRRAR